MEGDDGMRLLVVISADTWCRIMAEFAGGMVVERRWGYAWCNQLWQSYTWCNQLWQSLVEGGVWRGGVGLHMV